jgi:L-fuconolactonase
MIVDAHQHFWQVDRGDYGWLTPELTALYRDFLPEDLEPILQQNGVDRTILVQAAPTVAETEFMLTLAGDNAFILGVVGWVDFANPRAADEIKRLSEHPKLVGLRPMIQDIDDDDWMLGEHLAPAFEAMIEHNLTFDALVLPQHLPQLRKLIKRHPALKVVIDHGAKPEISGGNFEDWAENMSDIARDSTAFCKLSGLINEAGEHWSRRDLVPYIMHLLNTFGEDRLIWGSDWPVSTLTARYEIWLDLAYEFIQTDASKRKVFGLNAFRAYGIEIT